MISNEFHVIGGFSNKKHLIWNVNKDAFDEIYTFNELDCGLCAPGFTYLKIQNSFLLFGGYDDHSKLDTIYKYSLNTKKWIKCKERLLIKTSNFGIVVTKNEQYCIIIGGFGNDCNAIQIINLLNMNMKLSKIKCPTPTGNKYHAIIHSN